MNKVETKFDVKTVVATAIGAAIFFVLMRFVAIPTWVPNTTINVAYGFIALFGAVFGAVPAALAAFIGHWFTDLSYGGAWYSWIIGSASCAFALGYALKGNQVEKGTFDKATKTRFAIGAVVANALAWLVVAPGLDVLIYQQPFEVVFAQASLAAITNLVGTLVVGYILIEAYAKTRTQSGSLSAK